MAIVVGVLALLGIGGAVAVAANGSDGDNTSVPVVQPVVPADDGASATTAQTQPAQTQPDQTQPAQTQPDLSSVATIAEVDNLWGALITQSNEAEEEQAVLSTSFEEVDLATAVGVLETIVIDEWAYFNLVFDVDIASGIAELTTIDVLNGATCTWEVEFVAERATDGLLYFSFLDWFFIECQ